MGKPLRQRGSALDFHERTEQEQERYQGRDHPAGPHDLPARRHQCMPPRNGFQCFPASYALALVARAPRNRHGGHASVDFGPGQRLSRDGIATVRRERRHVMGARSEALAKQFESKAREALATVEQLSNADWKKVTEAEKWPVGVTAHHLAGALEPVSHLVKTLAAGEPLDAFSRGMLDEMNARHAREFADCTRSETIELHKRGMATAAAT